MTDIFRDHLLDPRRFKEPAKPLEETLLPERIELERKAAALDAESQALARCIDRIDEERAAIAEGRGGMFDRMASDPASLTDEELSAQIIAASAAPKRVPEESCSQSVKHPWQAAREQVAADSERTVSGSTAPGSPHPGTGGVAFDRATTPTLPAITIPPSERASDTPTARRLARDVLKEKEEIEANREVYDATFLALYPQWEPGPWSDCPQWAAVSREDAWLRFEATYRAAYDEDAEQRWDRAVTLRLEEMARFSAVRPAHVFRSFTEAAAEALAEAKEVTLYPSGRIGLVTGDLFVAAFVSTPELPTDLDVHPEDEEIAQVRLSLLSRGAVIQARNAWLVVGLYALFLDEGELREP